MTRPLVMLHGFAGAPENWGPLMERLPAEISPRAEPLLGHAAELIPARVPTFEEEVDRLAARIRDRARPPVDLVGYSLGARLALGLLVRHPALFRCATLISVHPGLFTPAEREERVRADSAWVDLLERDGISAFVTAWEAQPLFASQSRLAEAARAAQRARRLRHDPKGLALSLRATGLGAMPNYRPALAGLRTPVCLVAGKQDAKFCRLAGEMAAELPAGSLRLIPECGHNVPLEDPDTLSAVLKEVHR